MMGWYDHGMGWGGWVVMTLVTLAFWAVLIFGGIAVWRALRRDDVTPSPSPGDRRSEAERMLDERFARGEIDEDDYTRRRELLHSGR